MQTYLKTLVNMEGIVTINNLPFDDVKDRMVKYCTDKNRTDILYLALALAKYDFYGAPSNWYPNQHDQYYDCTHEQVILEWADWSNKQEEYNDTITDLISSYNEGLIPDAFDLMEDYFC